jgi:hypothetical protein
VASTPDTPDIDEAKAAKAADRFDIRRLIGALFAIYGLILTILGLIGSSHVKHKAAGINVDLWTGLGMLVFASLMIFWALSRPSSRQIGSQATPGRAGEQPST